MSAAELERLHDEIDRAVAPLEQRHADRLQCRRGCSACCVDEITVFEVEAERIRAHHQELLASGRPHPPGACAFLDAEGGCRIYADRPYVCRTQGLPLRWREENGQELRDICELNEVEEMPLETIDAGDCWTIGPHEGRLAQLQVEVGGAPPKRISLRELFGRGR